MELGLSLCRGAAAKTRKKTTVLEPGHDALDVVKKVFFIAVEARLE